MRILKNEPVLQKQSENYIRGELSNVAMVIQTPQVMTTYYSINADASTLVGGFENIEEFIGENSTVLYDKIENFPMSGIDNLIMMNEFNEDTGYDVNFDGQAIIFPNTVTPKPGDHFIVHGSKIPAIFVVTNCERTVVRSNPFIEINFKLMSQHPEAIKRIENQVKDEYVITVTSMGSDKTLLVKKENYFKIQDHIKAYLEVVDMYISLFYDRRRSMFVYSELFDHEKNMPIMIVDMVLWKFLYDNGIIVYDDTITYAINNLNYTIDRVYIDEPNKYIDSYEYRKTPLYRVYERNRKKILEEYPYPQTREEDTQVTKFNGINMVYIESYGTERDPFYDDIADFTIFDDSFLQRIRDNVKYCCQNTEVNWQVRNAIISYYNNESVNFDELSLEDRKNIENFYLIPILLGIYKQYIVSLQS